MKEGIDSMDTLAGRRTQSSGVDAYWDFENAT
jgi:hypothetical protein